MIACQRYLLWAYSICVFLPITIPWVVLGIGIALSLFMIVKERKYNPPPLTVTLLAFALCAFVSGLVSHGVQDAFDSLIGLRAFLVYFWAHYVFSHIPQERMKVVLILLCAGALDGCWGAVQQIFNFHPFEKYQYLQATGFVRNPMAFAGEMQVTSSIALALALGLKKLDIPINKFLYLIVVFANFLGVIFAAERSAWLGIACAVLAITFLVSKKLFFKTVLAGAVFVSILWFTVPVVKTRLEPLLTNAQSDTSTRVRFSIWKESIAMWQKGSFFGCGLNHFPKLDYKEAIVPGVSENLTHAHSNFIHLLVTLGILGLFSYLALSAQAVWLCIANWHYGSAPFDRYLALGVFGALVSLVIAGIFEYNFGAGHVRLIQWYVCAFLLSVNPKS